VPEVVSKSCRKIMASISRAEAGFGSIDRHHRRERGAGNRCFNAVKPAMHGLTDCGCVIADFTD
jgi:hypothetical protein